MNVTVEDLAPCKKLVRFEVEAKAVDDAFDTMAKDFIKEANLPGFRPGKAPKDMVLKKYEKEITEEVKKKLIGDTFRQGIYKLKAGTNELTFCVNLTDAAESNIQPRDDLPLGKYGKVAASTLKSANMELWRWLAAAGLLILLFEWWYYHKRTA